MLDSKEIMRRVARRFGYEIHRVDLTHAARRNRAMESRAIDLVLDVGANSGQYVTTIREAGYEGRVVSFEPMPTAFARLVDLHQHDSRWMGRLVALGASPGNATLNVAKSDVLSSLLQPTKTLGHHIPGAALFERIDVEVSTVDKEWEMAIKGSGSVMLKIDTQGFEHAVLKGAQAHLEMITLIEVEASLLPLYEGGSSLDSLLPQLRESGFYVVSIETGGGYVDAETGQVLDVNLLVARET